VNLYAGSAVKTRVAGNSVVLRQTTQYPWSGNVKLAIECNEPAEFDLLLRVPAWCQSSGEADELYVPLGRPKDGAFVVKVNNEIASPTIKDGYALLHRRWQRGDNVEIEMQMPARRLVANSNVKAAAGKIALSRGPIVYCLESIDNNGGTRNLSLPDDAELRTEMRADQLGGIVVLQAHALGSFVGSAPKSIQLTAIPFYADANRGPVTRCVWIPRAAADAIPASIADSAAPSASHTNRSDTTAALNDGILPKDSADESIPRFTWWDHRGTAEWVQYTFDKPARFSAISVYWWDERRINRHCRVPASWRLMYLSANGAWTPVSGASAYGADIDKFNRVTFDAVETKALRIEVQLQPTWSGGILEWRVEEAPNP